ncbi:hypothetical protein [Fusibacter sp. 3D3]|nr:hypothetical protein [Fusibacter sp. 3D3]GAU76356.1 hypothetical protein F3D3_0953 [Fusibacter sp. 3D3]
MNFGLSDKSLNMIINAIKACPNLEKAAKRPAQRRIAFALLF